MRILIAALAVIFSLPASAADYRPGPYAGITIGYAAGNLTNNGGDLATDGVPVSGIVGYTHAIANTGLIIGIEGEAAWNNVNGSQTGAGFVLEAKSDYTLALKARAGMAIGPALIYATAGPSWSHGRIEAIGLSDKHLTLGIAMGGGVDLQMTNTIALRLEAVRQLSAGSQTWTLGGVSEKLDAGETTLKLGVVFSLN